MFFQGISITLVLYSKLNYFLSKDCFFLLKNLLNCHQFILLVGLHVCLFVFNNRQNGKTDWVHFYVETNMTLQGRFMAD